MTPARRVEDACLNGWPALRQVVHGGLLLRFSEGYTRRANSANALGPLTDDPAAAIRFCETVYRAAALPPLFRISSAVDVGLGAALDDAGYAPPEDETMVLVRDLDDTPDRIGTVTPHPHEDWFEALAHVQNQTARTRILHRRIVEALAVPAGFASVEAEGRIAALCFGAVHHGIVCVNSVATDPNLLRRGHARAAIEAILTWARREHGATEACVPVIASNKPAVALYRGLGFDREALRYHYRRRSDVEPSK